MLSLPPDPYKILGVSKDAQLPEVRTAYRKLVLKCHPDKVQDPALKAEKQDEFQKVQQAYELLCDDKERAKYDDQVKLFELRKEMQKNLAANTSSPRTPPRYYEVRTVDPRPDSFKSSPRQASTAKMPSMYSQQYPRSWEDDLHSTTRIFEEPPRGARRTASYEKPSRREEERERERDRDRRKRKEAEEEVLRLARASEKAEKAEREARKAEKKKAEKERERDRRRDAEEKRRHKTPYVEPYTEDDDVVHVSRAPDKKKSTSKKHEEKEKREKSVPRGEDPAGVDATGEKINWHMQNAASYIETARQKRHHLSRSQTFQEDSRARYASPPAAVPTPPSAAPAPFPPPPPPPAPVAAPQAPAISVEEDHARRSSAKVSVRRSSHDTPRTRDRSSHKKSASGPKEVPPPPMPTSQPIIIDGASPSNVRHKSSFPETPAVPSSPPRRDLPRANTMNEGSYARPAPQPVSRAHTFHYGAEPAPADPRGRSRSRLHAQVTLSEDDDSEEDRRHRESRKHRERRHKTHSPEPIPADYPPPTTRHTRYAFEGGRTVPIPSAPVYYREELSPPPARRHSKSGATSHHPHLRPGMPPREGSYSGSGFLKVRESKAYGHEDVQYSKIPRYHDEQPYAQAQWA